MAALGKKFDATAFDTEPQEYELLPEGIYRLEIIASEVKEEDGNKQVPITIGVIEPEEYARRQIRLWIDYEHSDADKQARGQRELAQICRAVGVNDPENTEELHLIGFTAKVKKGTAGVSKAGNPYKARNSITRYYYPDEGNAPEPFVDAAAAAAPARQPAANNNRQPAANQNPAPPAKAAGSKPWGAKK